MGRCSGGNLALHRQKVPGPRVVKHTPWHTHNTLTLIRRGNLFSAYIYNKLTKYKVDLVRSGYVNWCLTPFLNCFKLYTVICFQSWRNWLFMGMKQQPFVSNWWLHLMGFEPKPQHRGVSSFKVRLSFTTQLRRSQGWIDSYSSDHVRWTSLSRVIGSKLYLCGLIAVKYEFRYDVLFSDREVFHGT